MHRLSERLHLPVLDPPNPRHGDRFGLRPSAQYHRRVRHTPAHPGGAEDHDRIRRRERHAMTGRTRRPPPRFPAIRPEPINAQRVRSDSYARPGRLQDGAIPSDRESGRNVTDSALGLDPVHEAGGPRYPERNQYGCNPDHDHEFEKCEPLGHAPFIPCRRNPAAPGKPGEKPENAPFAG
jgi:hypothetical protein